MATMTSITCREHGGMFRIVPRRGRPPVRCTDENKCTRHPDIEKPYSVSADTGFRSATKATKAIKAQVHTNGRSIPPKTHVEPHATAELDPGRSVVAAKVAARKLLALAWVVKAKTETNGSVTVIAAREEELLTLTFQDGECISQDYSLWNADNPPNIISAKDNILSSRGDKLTTTHNVGGMPRSKLPFNTSEVPDWELVRVLAGTKCTWWNHLAQHEETAIIGSMISIEHLYTGKGDEHPEDRIFKFTDRSGQGFRAFRLGALLSFK